MPEEIKEKAIPEIKEKVVLLEILDPRTEVKTVIHASKVSLNRYEIQEILDNFDEIEVISFRRA